jgi:twinkle protein
MKRQHVSDSEIVQSGLPCGACGSRNNVKRYSDGHTYCFGCGDHQQGDGSITTASPQTTRTREMLGLIEPGDALALPARKITQTTAQHFGYTVSKYKSTPCQVAPYYDREGNLIGQKVRLPNKDFKWLGGDQKDAMPFGWHAFPRSAKMLTLVEGEVDALSLSQVQGNKYPVWSIPTGAGPQLRNWLARRVEEGIFGPFETVVVMFDNDERGREATRIACEVIGSKARVASLPLKDANEMLVEGRTEELLKCMWAAQPYRPEGIVELTAVKEEEARSVDRGISYPFPDMDRITYGSRDHELVGIGAGAGAGKTDFLTEVITHFALVHNIPVGAFFLESSKVDLTRRVMGKTVSKTFHIPDSGWTQADKDEAWQKLESAAPIFLYDSFGVNEWDPIKAQIKYLFHAHGVKRFVLDHLTAFAAADPSNERQILEEVMGSMASLVQEIPISIFFVSHLATPEGKPHEEGGHISLRHFKGARAIGFWATAAFGLERNQQAEDKEERYTTTVRCVKNRPFGHLNGETFQLRYVPSTGRLVPVDTLSVSLFEDETCEGKTSDKDF